MTEKYVKRGDAEYPEHVMRVMGEKAPMSLHMMGNFDLLKQPGIGFSGTRNPSVQGRALAAVYATEVAERKRVLVSGNAKGIDFVAHHYSLTSGGNTIFVLPEGMHHFMIKKDMVYVWDTSRVLVISQFHASDPWAGWRAMERNKLIIALSSAMIVFEPGEKGGTLAAGEQTLAAGMPLFVADSTPTPGKQLLLDKGATLLTSLEQVITAGER